MGFRKQVLIRAPPKAVFQFLFDVTTLEEYTPWKITPLGDEVGVGFRWRESRLLRRRLWTVTAFDRRALSMTATTAGLTLRLGAKKGGTGSCNVVMEVEGDARAVARFERSDGDRLQRLRDWLDV